MGFWIYLMIGVLAVWPFGRLMGQLMLIDTKDQVERGFAAAFGVVAAALWPVALLAVLAWSISKAVWVRVLGLREDDYDRERS